MSITTKETHRLAAWLAGAAIVFGVACAAGGASWQRHVDDTENPDWTVASCSEWGPDLTGEATLPAYTYTDRCMESTGQIIFPKDLDTVEDFGQ